MISLSVRRGSPNLGRTTALSGLASGSLTRKSKLASPGEDRILELRGRLGADLGVHPSFLRMGLTEDCDLQSVGAKIPVEYVHRHTHAFVRHFRSRIPFGDDDATERISGL